MRRRVRSWCIYLATAAGLFCAITTWGLQWALTSVSLVAVSAALVAATVWAEDGRRAVPRIARVAFAAGLIAPAALGLVVVCKLAGVLVVLMLAGTTPALTSLVRARRLARGSLPVVQPESSATPDLPAPWGQPSLKSSSAEPVRELSSLDDDALCLAWRRSFLLLEEARSAAARLSIVEQRQKYLDELQQRSPEGIAAWLASGARASGNPFPYLADRQRRQPG
ncbi:hypothetical protein [Kribbella sp. VKM Ac-2568]|uniref:hypothetical protein n=1 Tax=Kribbella sp. VKM Ac-2568 TaxID=2512219 RepID=UPI0010431925|nr:hypothetical protein [Kribbella sp. VKM Ac-2568]TCM50542.1 hypothetical protein EV648_102586 [Kribbella sp. VKM Ac-2568]